MSNVIDMFPKAEDAQCTISFNGEHFLFPLSTLEDYVEGREELDPAITKAIVAIFHDLACEGFFDEEE